MSVDPMAAEYRRRAAELRALAGQLDESPVLGLDAAAGADTWSSPGADACRTTLADDQVRLRSAAAELRQQASWYEHQADALDAIAAAGRLPAGG
jgi:hypothetical protein